MNIELLRQFGQRLLTPYGSQGHLRFESRRVVPAGSSAHRLSCSAAILAAVRQRLHLSDLFKNPEPALRRLAVCCPTCGTRAVAPPPEAARGTPFGPRLHAVATYLKTFQALSYERLQSALCDLFGLSLSQGGLMNLLRRAQGRFAGGRRSAISALRQAEMVASDETGVRIEGANAYHWVFRSPEAVVHHAAPTRSA